MEDLDAPQWVDFTAPSPHINQADDYFYRRNSENERMDPPDDKVLQKTPVRKIVSKGPKNFQKNVEETTVNNILCEAMNNLQLSVKKMHYRKVHNNSHSIAKKEINEENKENDENIESHESIEQDNLYEQTSQIILEVTSTSTEHDVSIEKEETEKESQHLLNKIETFHEITQNESFKSPSIHSNSFKNESKKKVSLLTGNAWHRQVKRRISIINQRRISILKTKIPAKDPENVPKKVNAQHVSLAEAVMKFHSTTPQRYRTANVKSTRTEKLKISAMKLTKAQSPALRSKNRVRSVTVLSREEREKLEVEKIHQNQFKANPLRKDILERPAPIKKVTKKMVTSPKPFPLTKTKKEQKTSTVKPIQEIKRCNSFIKKTVPSIMQDETGIIVKDEEVLGFGIPTGPCKTKKKNTIIQPFSFETRNKELAMKKQERLKKIQQERKTKPEFHARPVPTVLKTQVKKPNSQTDLTKKTKITLPRSVSFESKVKQLQQKRDEKVKEILEEEKKARIFKAQKAPEFKPVLVRGRSRDNLLKRSNENLASKSLPHHSGVKKTDNSFKKSHENLLPVPKNIKKPINSVPLKKNVPSTTTGNQGAVPKIMAPKCKLSQKSVAVLSELNTEKRAKERQEFDEKLKIKDLQDDEMKRQEEEDRIAKEKEENSELRKMAEVKARPMPIYKPLQAIKSNKALTNPQSPAWARKKSTHLP